MVALGVGLCSGLIVGTAGAQGMIGPSLAEAQKALTATEAAAIEMGVGLSCAVVDSRGALVALARMDDARYFTADVAVGKARASAAFGAPSGELTRLASMGLDEAIHGGPTRFGRPRHLMSYSGTVASEHSSGDRIRRGGITKTGNAHLRRIVIEAAWAYRHRPGSARGRRRARDTRTRSQSPQLQEFDGSSDPPCSHVRRRPIHP